MMIFAIKNVWWFRVYMMIYYSVVVLMMVYCAVVVLMIYYVRM